MPGTFDQVFSGVKDVEALDLLRKCLLFDCDERITIEQALAHPYLKKLHQPNDEPVDDVVSAFDFEFELFSLSSKEYKKLIYDEIMLYHDEATQKKYAEDLQNHPTGVMNQVLGKERLRTMYKTDPSMIARVSDLSDAT